MPKKVRFRVPFRRLSVYKGYRLENIRKLEKNFLLESVILEPSDSIGDIELEA